jgi:hypothetical protein
MREITNESEENKAYIEVLIRKIVWRFNEDNLIHIEEPTTEECSITERLTPQYSIHLSLKPILDTVEKQMQEQGMDRKCQTLHSLIGQLAALDEENETSSTQHTRMIKYHISSYRNNDVVNWSEFMQHVNAIIKSLEELIREGKTEERKTEEVKTKNTATEKKETEKLPPSAQDLQAIKAATEDTATEKKEVKELKETEKLPPSTQDLQAIKAATEDTATEKKEVKELKETEKLPPSAQDLQAIKAATEDTATEKKEVKELKETEKLPPSAQDLQAIKAATEKKRKKLLPSIEKILTKREEASQSTEVSVEEAAKLIANDEDKKVLTKREEASQSTEVSVEEAAKLIANDEDKKVLTKREEASQSTQESIEEASQSTQESIEEASQSTQESIDEARKFIIENKEQVEYLLLQSIELLEGEIKEAIEFLKRKISKTSTDETDITEEEIELTEEEIEFLKRNTVFSKKISKKSTDETDITEEEIKFLKRKISKTSTDETDINFFFIKILEKKAELWHRMRNNREMMLNQMIVYLKEDILYQTNDLITQILSFQAENKKTNFSPFSIGLFKNKIRTLTQKIETSWIEIREYHILIMNTPDKSKRKEENEDNHRESFEEFDAQMQNLSSILNDEEFDVQMQNLYSILTKAYSIISNIMPSDGQLIYIKDPQHTMFQVHSTPQAAEKSQGRLLKTLQTAQTGFTILKNHFLSIEDVDSKKEEALNIDKMASTLISNMKVCLQETEGEIEIEKIIEANALVAFLERKARKCTIEIQEKRLMRKLKKITKEETHVRGKRRQIKPGSLEDVFKSDKGLYSTYQNVRKDLLSQVHERAPSASESQDSEQEQQPKTKENNDEGMWAQIMTSHITLLGTKKKESEITMAERYLEILRQISRLNVDQMINKFTENITSEAENKIDEKREKGILQIKQSLNIRQIQEENYEYLIQGINSMKEYCAMYSRHLESSKTEAIENLSDIFKKKLFHRQSPRLSNFLQRLCIKYKFFDAIFGYPHRKFTTNVGNVEKEHEAHELPIKELHNAIKEIERSLAPHQDISAVKSPIR